MNHKILLADDSLTIQKVIKITLANQPYDIFDCVNDEDLFKKLTEVKPKLVCLDFNLSEKYTGYELTSKIKSALPSTKVLLLLGTFDTVDDAAMEKCGASDKIVKPFDSNKFIAICKHLVDTSAEDTEEAPFEKQTKKELPEEDFENQWQMNHSSGQKFTAPKGMEEEKPKAPSMNALAQEVSDWGMSVPGVINDRESHDKQIDLPPVIGEVKSLEAHRNKIESAAKEGQKFPENSDLDYPTMEELIETTSKPTSKLVPLEELHNASHFEVEHQINSMDESDVKSIEAQIQDEVGEDLWQADEFEELKKEVSSKFEEVKSGFTPSREDFNESLFNPLDDKESIDWTATAPAQAQTSSENLADLRGEIESMVKKYVKEYMDQMFQQNVEKVTWEVVPDLAENIIRQELGKISNRILNEP